MKYQEPWETVKVTKDYGKALAEIDQNFDLPDGVAMKSVEDGFLSRLETKNLADVPMRIIRIIVGYELEDIEILP